MVLTLLVISCISTLQIVIRCRLIFPIKKVFGYQILANHSRYFFVHYLQCLLYRIHLRCVLFETCCPFVILVLPTAQRLSKNNRHYMTANFSLKSDRDAPRSSTKSFGSVILLYIRIRRRPKKAKQKPTVEGAQHQFGFLSGPNCFTMEKRFTKTNFRTIAAVLCHFC